MLNKNNKSIKAYADSLIRSEEPAMELTLTPSEQQEAGKIHSMVSTCWKPRTLTAEELSALKELSYSEKCRHMFSLLLKQQSVNLGV